VSSKPPGFIHGDGLGEPTAPKKELMPVIMFFHWQERFQERHTSGNVIDSMSLTCNTKK
jgi:hypothetical protein